MSSFINLSGQEFGRLIVNRPAGVDEWGSYKWHCICSCGSVCTPSSGSLRRGRAQSCGCLKIEAQNKKHPPARKYRDKWNAANRIKVNAHTAVHHAIRKGVLIKPSMCSECGKESIIHGHHDDYSKLMDVRWLCQTCHFLWHNENGAGLNA